MRIVGKMKVLVKLLRDPDFRFCYLSEKNMKRHVSGEKFLSIKYRTYMGRELNLAQPVKYTEKLQWLKLYDHRPEYTEMVDKYQAKKFVADRIGEQYVVPVLGVWDRVSDIDFDALPDSFVLKATHDSGGTVICRTKKNFDRRQAVRKLEKALKRNYYERNREWPYKNVKPRIIAEAYMEDSQYHELRDYKFFTFGGEPKVLYIAQGRGQGIPTVADFFDMDFNHLPFTIDHEMAPVPPEKPKNFELMKQLAAELSRGTPQLRVDFYEVDGKVYFGEMTFFHCSGLAAFHPEQWDDKFGSWVTLPNASHQIASDKS